MIRRLVAASILIAACSLPAFAATKKPVETPVANIAALYSRLTDKTGKDSSQWLDTSPAAGALSGKKRTDFLDDRKDEIKDALKKLESGEPIILEVPAHLEENIIRIDFSRPGNMSRSYAGYNFFFNPVNAEDFRSITVSPDAASTILNIFNTKSEITVTATLSPQSASTSVIETDGKPYLAINSTITNLEVWNADGSAAVWNAHMPLPAPSPRQEHPKEININEPEKKLETPEQEDTPSEPAAQQ